MEDMMGINPARRRLFSTCACCDPPASAGAPSLDRRNFIAGGVAALGLGATAAVVTPGKMFAQAKPHRIDVHHHVSPPPWIEALKKAHMDSPPVNNWTPQRSLEDMDKGDTATAILSVTQPALDFLDPKEAAAVARASNEYAKKLAQDHPGRFGLFAVLPMPHVDETLKELEYALDTLKADGVGFMTSYGDKYLGDAAFAPVMDELNRRKATAYTHPNNPACCVNNLAGLPPVYIEYGTDTTRTIASLIFSGTSARCPDLNFIFSHAGGTVTSLTERFTVQMMADPRYKAFTGAGVMSELRRFYYDTAQASNAIAMASLTKMVAISQIVFGTDYPYRSSVDHVKGLTAIFSAEDLKKIDRENALKLVPRWRSA
jgi:predicted TIM-barrel fold metal-dependent hydrolase